MRNKIIASVALAACLFTHISTALAASFSDVNTQNKNYDAIEYLKDVGVINGYPDQTFRPEKSVNRAEFLKLALESSNIPTNVAAPAPFPDVDNSAWYAPYLRKAFAEKWIEGYQDGTFKPESTINKVEALKITAVVQGWEISKDIGRVPFQDTARAAWYTPYVAYAKNHNFLEEQGTFFGPATNMTRASISEILFRSHITNAYDEENYDTSFLTDYKTGTVPNPIIETNSSQTFTSVASTQYPTTTFQNITLKNTFPSIFYHHEVYYFEGSIKSGTYSKAFVFLAPEDAFDSDAYITYIIPVENNTFSIPVIFRKPGNYRLGIILGSSGESNVANISVVSQLPTPQNATPGNKTPTSLNINYQDQNTTFGWQNADATFKRLIIFQGNKTVPFYFRQDQSSFNIDYQDFAGFSEGTTFATLQTANYSSTKPLVLTSDWSPSSQINFTATTHHQSIVEKTDITYSTLPELYNQRQAITFSGTAKTDILVKAAVIKPDGFVDFFNLTSPQAFGEYYGSNSIPSGNQYTFSYTPPTDGTYIIEINNTGGSAVLNTSVYIKNGIPLVPDFFDLHELSERESSFSLSTARSQLLTLINQERANAGLSPVVFDNDLTSLAQGHSQDMLNRNFFNHINPDGDGPDDRRKTQGIPTPVGENIAIAPTIEYTHYGLMYSAIHRSNILDSKWKRVGIGIVQNTNGSLITTQEFSTYELTQDEINAIKQRTLESIQAARNAKGIAAFIYETDLQSVALTWSQKMADQGFFDFVAPDGQTLSQVINESHVGDGHVIQALIAEASDEEALIEKILTVQEITKSQWEKTGIGLTIDSVGVLKCTILLKSF